MDVLRRLFEGDPKVLRDTLDGDEPAHDRDDDCGPVGHADNQAPPDRPVTNFVSPARTLRPPDSRWLPAAAQDERAER
jgi:hypothetical protein